METVFAFRSMRKRITGVYDDDEAYAVEGEGRSLSSVPSSIVIFDGVLLLKATEMDLIVEAFILPFLPLMVLVTELEGERGISLRWKASTHNQVEKVKPLLGKEGIPE